MWNWQTIAGKRVFICEVHHHVLEAWAEMRKTLDETLTLITLDYHTDTLPAFGRYTATQLGRTLGHPPSPSDLAEAVARESAAQLSAVDWGDPRSVRDLITRLKYDEHIDCALRAGVLAQVFILLGCDTPQNTPAFAQVLLPERRCAHQDLAPHDAACERLLVDTLLEDDHLGRQVARIERSTGAQISELPYVLDIDLDFFRSAKAAAPTQQTTFHALIRHARYITIAREAGCVGLLRLPGEEIVSADLERAVLAHIRAACTPLVR